MTNSLATHYPKLAKTWHRTKNELKPTEVTANANYVAWWVCPKKHEWKAVVNNRTSLGTGCPDCHEQRIEGLRDFPEYLKYFDYVKNKGIDPMKLLIGKTVWWRCDKAKDHRWQMAFWKTHVEEACPFCRGYKASSTNNLTLAKDLMKDFDARLNPGIKPKDIPLGSGTEILWRCAKCNHQWKCNVSARYKRGDGCRPCATANRWKAYYQGKK